MPVRIGVFRHYIKKGGILMAKSLIIDPGHGGTDNGASGFGVKEKDWTLKMSIYQYNRLKELGAAVSITRKTDQTLTSVQRSNLIKGKYDYCMSNHFNSFNGTARGVETIYSIYSNDKIARQLANIIVSTSSLPLRRVFQRQGNNGDYYFMHRLTGNTETIIVEYGFIDNKSDNDYYKNDKNFYKVAEAVVKQWCTILGVTYSSKANVTEDTSKYTVVRTLDGYQTALDAKNRIHQQSTVQSGMYYVFNRSNGMVNVTTKQGSPGSWINPADNQTVQSSQSSSFLIKTKPDYLWYYNKLDWDARTGTVRKGTILTVVRILTVNGSTMYQLKSGNYITANPLYVAKV